MVGVNKQPTSDDGTYLRKIMKPLIEKKRRDRMNHSITQLRALIDETVKQNVPPMTRVDKADILELTVCHLSKLRQQSVAMPTNNRTSYAAGFQDCAKEVTAFLVSNGLIDDCRLSELSGHLSGSFNRRSVQGIPQNGHISTPNRTQQSPYILEGTPIHLSKLSPIPSNSFYGNYSPPLRIGFIDKSDGASNSFCAQPYATINDAHASRLPLSPIDSLRASTNTSTSSLEETSSLTSLLSSTEEHVVGRHSDDRLVSIGTGSENKIGHVISESTWRPW